MSLALQLRLHSVTRSARPALLSASRASCGATRGISAVSTNKDDVLKHFEKNEITKDVIPKFDPKVQLKARFLSSGEDVSFGNNLTPVDAQGKPEITILPFPGEDAIDSSLAGKNAYVVMTDPDAPKREDPKWSEFAHWIAQVKLPSDKGGEVVHNSKESKDVLEYTGPAPPEGKHRYVLLLLSGEESNVEPPSERKKWGNKEQRTGVAQWADKYGLRAIGGNFFFSEPKKEQSKDDLHHDERGLGPSGPGYGG